MGRRANRDSLLIGTDTDLLNEVQHCGKWIVVTPSDADISNA